MAIATLLLILAFVCFLLAVFNVPRFNWTAAGLALWVLSILIGSHVFH